MLDKPQAAEFDPNAPKRATERLEGETDAEYNSRLLRHLATLEQRIASGSSAKLDGYGPIRWRVNDGVSTKTGEKMKGGLSLFGLGRNPVTLYESQWLQLLDEGHVSALRQYIAENTHRLAKKPVKEAGSAE